MPRHPAMRFGAPRLAAVTTVLAVGFILPSPPGSGGPPAGGPSAGGPSASGTASARPSAGRTSGAKTVWAATASGRKVPVPPPHFIPTPVHPEKITHPRTDTMQIVTAAHGKFRHSVRMQPALTTTQLPGIDISAYQGNINWGAVSPYIDFSYAKATEGTYYTNPYFYNQYEGPYNSGLIRGAYHFAIPNNSSGQSQALYFIKHGGGWSADGRTLPGALDIEYNPYGSECYGFTNSQMRSWIDNFVTEYAYKEGVYPVIYSTTDWWTTCTGNASRFGKWDPLWIANYGASGGGPLPNGWSFYTFWQYSDSGNLPGDQDVFNGDHSRLKTLASNG